MSNFNRIETAGNIVRRVLGSIGLPQPQDILAATDLTTKQMVALLTECGQDLIGMHGWQFLNKTWQFDTTAEVAYDLPEDWESFVNEAAWNNSGRLPMIGPISDQSWRMLQARQLGGTTLRLMYKIENNQLLLYFAPTPAQTLAMDYTSRGWVQDAADSAVYRDYVSADADKILFRPRLMISYLKYRWRETKGFDPSAAFMEFQSALSTAKADDKPSQDLAIGTRQGFPYLGYVNMPDTGYG